MRLALVVAAVCCAAQLCNAAEPTKLTVVNTNDAGPGSLREVLNASNKLGGHTVIAFNIPKSDPRYDAKAGTWTITYLDTPPPITVSDISIDGLTQAANQGDTNPDGPEIVLGGGNYSVEYAFVLVNAANITIRGLVINEFLYGVQVYGAGSHHNRIVGNYVGVNSAGTQAVGNYNGIELLSGAHDNTVGGLTPEERNIVSGNQHIGIRISDAHKNVVQGNYVGTDRTGMHAVPNYDGICAEGRSKGNIIGGAVQGARNIASGNVAYGMDFFGAGVQDNVILGNFMGTDVSGTKAIPNTYGILFDDRASRNVVGGLGDGEWNLISGNTAFGAYFYNNGTNSNVVRGNRIGTDATGTLRLPNETGVHIDGGTFKNIVDRNVISANVVAGVTVFALYTDANTLTRNLIGTDLSGSRPLGNGEDGIRVAFGPKRNLIGGNTDDANVIAHNGRHGVVVESDESTGNRISCNSIYQNRNLGISVVRTAPLASVAKPVITSVRNDVGKCIVSGTITALNPASITIEAFAGDTNERRQVQGRTYLGKVNPDQAGNWSVEATVARPVESIAATATDANGNTSEFGQWHADR